MLPTAGKPLKPAEDEIGGIENGISIIHKRGMEGHCDRICG